MNRTSPSEALVSASRDAQVVVGSRSRDGFGGLPLGSVSQQLPAQRALPVLVVRPTSTG